MAAIKLIQMTDCHLLADAGAEHKRVNPYRTLRHVGDYMRRHHGDADALLLTGDLSENGSRESYRLLGRALDGIGAAMFALPGNHDEPDNMEALTDAGVGLEREIDLGAWRVLMASSRMPGRVEGRLENEELAWLEESLQADGRPRLLAVHHQPLPIGSPWMDRVGLLNGDAVVALARRYPHLKCLIHGHTHQASCIDGDGLPCYGTPSTWRQFTPAVDFHRMDTLPPALRVVRLFDNGDHTSCVEFVQMTD